MPSGIPIDWDYYLPIMRRHLPGMTIVEFQHQYAPDISPKTLRRIANQNQIDFVKVYSSPERSQKISESLLKDDPDLIVKIRELRDELSDVKIAKRLNVSKTLVNRLIKRHNIQLSERGRQRVKKDISAAIKKATQKSMGAPAREKRSKAMAKRKLRGLKTYKGSTVKSKKGGTIETKSSWETAYIHQLDADPTVESFQYETIIIRYRYKKLNRNYVPDFVVKFTDGHFEIHEVKPKNLCKNARNKAKFAAARRCIIPFVLITEEQLTHL